MTKIACIFLLSFCTLGAQTYCAGDQISLDHQNQLQSVCAAYDGYEVGDMFKLADYNGDLNGGNYHVIFIDMGATW